ncbi:MAG: exosortase-associated EpsI family protein [Akkermansia sp.]|nr:exosortase-associated EpsI family protein [Akkermansia sp.]
MIRKLLRSLLPPLLTVSILSCVFILPREEELVESSISPDLPLHDALAGWQGRKVQESERERRVLAADTRFSKATYSRVKRVPWEKSLPPVEISIVYSGRDMNASIHRPERCLPSQGHLNLQGKSDEITLKDGRKLNITRLSSQVQIPGEKKQTLNFIHYYIFVGHSNIHHTHLGRTAQDMYDRVAKGYVQRWAYFQAGSYWSPELGISKSEADKHIRDLISDLLPGQINWQEM